MSIGSFEKNLHAITGSSGKQKITGMVAATALTVPEGATHALIQAETQNVRWWPGTDPTSSDGHLLIVGTFLLYDYELRDIRFIEAASGAVLQVSYFQRLR